MKLVSSIIRIAIAVAIVNAAVRVGVAYWSFYQWKDYAQQTAVLGARLTPQELQNDVLKKAGELLIPVRHDSVDVTRNGMRTIIQGNYVHPIEYFPNQIYPMKFDFQVEATNMAGLR
jgi:hypothetical protein